MPFLFLVLLFLVPAVEVSLMMRVSEVLGGWNTLALVVLTAVVGVSLVRSQGVVTLMSVQRKLAYGEVPGQEIIEGMMLALAGVLLLIPGFMTDLIGLLMLTPFTRAPIAKMLLKRLQLQVVTSRFGQGNNPFSQGPFNPSDFSRPRQDDDVIDGEYEHKAEEVKPESRLRTPIDNAKERPEDRTENDLDDDHDQPPKR
ncbi:FxsA family protein [Shewanella avicenniae]|uniref:FxsA family protein n=1 Tax=Shewanella avicenniae TaxID=2814294 RepID=A0ABX7QPZ9_9GAMM|nr:FxsA family protein [Shewanella avicenniae]QSX32955.1 FxsA family protein [Shewanella avicenniae]